MCNGSEQVSHSCAVMGLSWWGLVRCTTQSWLLEASAIGSVLTTRIPGHRSQTTMQFPVCLALLVFPSVTLPAAPGGDKQPNRWEKDIAAFEKRDQDKPPPKNAVLFVGSSTIRLWDLGKAFPGIDTINRGF